MSLHNCAHWPEILLERLRLRCGLLWACEARLKGARVGGGVRLYGRPILTVAKQSRLEIGDGVTLSSGRRSNLLGNATPCVLRTLAPGAELILGEGVGISSAVLCAGRSIRIGARTILGSGAMILDNDFHRRDADGGWPSDCTTSARPVLIGTSVFIGARAIILKGVTIGDGAQVGAGAVVTRDVPPRAVAFGNPAEIKIASP